RLALYLRKKGVTRETRVIISMAPSVELIVGILAILKAGGCYVPVDTNTPAERFNFILEDSGAAIIITDADGARAFKDVKAPVCIIENILNSTTDSSNEKIEQLPNHDQLAYLIYTSGTTGKPKGVLVEHNNACRLFEVTENYFHFTEKDTWVLFHSYAFDFSVWEIFGALLHGGKLLILDYKRSGSFEDFVNLLIQEKVTLLNQTPSAFYPLIPYLVNGLEKLSLRAIVFGGEALSFQQLKNWFADKRSEKINLVNMYGITETTVHTTFYNVKQSDVLQPHSKIGHALSDLQVYVLDEHLDSLPHGVVGELYIGGEGVARGYWNRTELTESRFLLHPENGERIYKSGDLVSMQADGEMNYCGRSDQQVKIRGYRIETGEVENAFLELGYVKQVVVRADTGENNSKRLVAFVVLNKEINSSEIKKELAARLPEYMIPSLIVISDSFKLNINGKIDKQSLIIPDHTTQLQKVFIEPQTATEKIIAAIWSSVMGIEKISVSDNFYELGGHSLQALLITSRIRKQFGVAVTVDLIFTSANLEDLAKEIDEAPVSEENELKKLPEQADYEISHAQARMYVLSKLEQEKSRYNIASAFYITGKPDKEKLRRAFFETVQKHESLRTFFIEKDFVPRQVIVEKEKAQLFFKEINDYKKPELALDNFKTLAVEAMDLSDQRLLKIYFYTINENEYLLGVSLHHIISDGWSAQVLIAEVLNTYRALTKGFTPQQTELPVHYKEYAAWENELIKNLKPGNQYSNYWKNELNDLDEIVHFPYDNPTTENTEAPELINVSLNKQQLESLKQFCKNENITVNTLILSSVFALMFRVTGKNDISIGTLFSGRKHHLLNEQIGCYVNTLVQRQKVKQSLLFKELAKEVNLHHLNTLKYGSYPFDRLLMEWERNGQRTEPFSVMVSYQNTGNVWKIIEDMEELKINFQDLQIDSSKFDITILADETEDALHISVQYNKLRYLPQTAEKILSGICAILEQVSNDADVSLEDLVLSENISDKTSEIELDSDFNFNF
ncbi:MAG: amino acid adenylation domain-containing protein, partial [Bacteroidia bacterium]|nr:amino acid adenylation domain-containing protein [Bacteroidia bacterium]